MGRLSVAMAGRPWTCYPMTTLVRLRRARLSLEETLFSLAPGTHVSNPATAPIPYKIAVLVYVYNDGGKLRLLLHRRKPPTRTSTPPSAASSNSTSANPPYALVLSAKSTKRSTSSSPSTTSASLGIVSEHFLCVAPARGGGGPTPPTGSCLLASKSPAPLNFLPVESSMKAASNGSTPSSSPNSPSPPPTATSSGRSSRTTPSCSTPPTAPTPTSSPSTHRLHRQRRPSSPSEALPEARSKNKAKASRASGLHHNRPPSNGLLRGFLLLDSCFLLLATHSPSSPAHSCSLTIVCSPPPLVTPSTQLHHFQHFRPRRKQPVVQPPLRIYRHHRIKLLIPSSPLFRSEAGHPTDAAPDHAAVPIPSAIQYPARGRFGPTAAIHHVLSACPPRPRHPGLPSGDPRSAHRHPLQEPPAPPGQEPRPVPPAPQAQRKASRPMPISWRQAKHPYPIQYLESVMFLTHGLFPHQPVRGKDQVAPSYSSSDSFSS